MLKKLPLSIDNKRRSLRNIAQQTLFELATEEGINASGKDEIYGCIFGRDSALTILQILQAHKKDPNKKLLRICKKALLTLISLQGKEFNVESGEEPGKFIHEYRKERHEHLTGREKDESKPWENPWYLYPDNTMKSYDSIDATPLALIAIYKYWEISRDGRFLVDVLPAVEAGLNWIISFGDIDKDLLIEYHFNPQRTHGGLLVQSWTDSHESMRQADGNMPKYPIAPVEVQGYAWLALKLWGEFYKDHAGGFAQKLLQQATEMKKNFNNLFIFKDEGYAFAAQALDGDKNQIPTITGNPLMLLWASYKKGTKSECIIETSLINDFIKRGFMSDMFDPHAGIRTMSTHSATFNPNDNSYHNGSFWPVLNGLIYQGLIHWGYKKEANALKKASLEPIEYFNSPIELYIKDSQGNLKEFNNGAGQTGCKEQAWTAGMMLNILSDAPLTYIMQKPLITLWQDFLTKPLEYYTIKKAVSQAPKPF